MGSLTSHEKEQSLVAKSTKENLVLIAIVYIDQTDVPHPWHKVRKWWSVQQKLVLPIWASSNLINTALHVKSRL